ncbi:MAG: MGMT family protein [Balneolales bacterium]|nr:MGMT family protein [Balneolales bacterium]
MILLIYAFNFTQTILQEYKQAWTLVLRYHAGGLDRKKWLLEHELKHAEVMAH